MPLTGIWLEGFSRHVLRAVQVALVITSVGDCTFVVCQGVREAQAAEAWALCPC